MKYVRNEPELGVCQLWIEGALDALTVRDIDPVIDAVVASKPKRVNLDLEALTLLDSSGVGAIISLFRRVAAGGGRLAVVRAHDQPLAVLKVLKLDRALGCEL